MRLWYNQGQSEVSVLVRPIYVIPRNSEVLRKRSVRVRSPREATPVIEDLVDTWPTVAAHGIAAVQIGVTRRLFVYRPYEDDDEVPPTALVRKATRGCSTVSKNAPPSSRTTTIATGSGSPSWRRRPGS